jgi:hypothetical protein
MLLPQPKQRLWIFHKSEIIYNDIKARPAFWTKGDVTFNNEVWDEGCNWLEVKETWYEFLWMRWSNFLPVFEEIVAFSSNNFLLDCFLNAACASDKVHLLSVVDTMAFQCL